MTGFDVGVSSRLAVDPDRLWAIVSTMEGVNAELAPLMRMSIPRAARGRSLAEVPLGEVAFVSTLLAFGWLPFDRHRLCLIEVEHGRRFLERSSSWLQRVWEHERWLVPVPGGVEITDRLRVEPRVELTSGLTRSIVERLFAHRHQRLRKRFGEIDPL